MKVVLLQQIQHQTDDDDDDEDDDDDDDDVDDDDDDDDDDDCSHIYIYHIYIYIVSISPFRMCFFGSCHLRTTQNLNVTKCTSHRRQEYSKQVKANANSLAEALKSKGAKKPSPEGILGDFFAFCRRKTFIFAFV